jgi:hypothetical protein
MLKWNGGSNTPIFTMKKYLILTDTVANRKKIRAGEVIELSEEEGRSLCSYGKAEVFVEQESKKVDRSVGLEQSDAPKVSKRKAKK